jgi:cytochrome c
VSLALRRLYNVAAAAQTAINLIEQAGDSRLGPSLHGIIGAKAGQSAGYAYSQSLRQSGVTWNEATLERWIENPEAVIPNNNMKPYTGLADAAVRKKIVEFLKKNNDAS